MKSTISRGEELSTQPRMSADLISEWQQSDGSPNYKKSAISEFTLQPQRSRLQLIHAIPGRLRLRATDRRFRSILNTISQQLRQQDGVGEVHINQQTGSLVVTFDKNRLSLPQILGVLQQIGVYQPQESLIEEKLADSSAVWKSGDLPKEQRIDVIALVIDLLIAGMLRIQTLAAIPVYLMRRGTNEQEQTSRGTRGQGQLQWKQDALFVAHAIPGRVRFNVPRIARDRECAQRLEKLLKADAQVTSVRVNRDAASIAINYQPGEMLDYQVRSHLASLIQEGAGSREQGAGKIGRWKVFACSLEVRRASVSSDSCGLLKSRSRKPLKGGAIAARSNRLRRLGVLI